MAVRTFGILPEFYTIRTPGSFQYLSLQIQNFYSITLPVEMLWTPFG